MKVQAPLPASVSNSIWVQQAHFPTLFVPHRHFPDVRAPALKKPNPLMLLSFCWVWWNMEVRHRQSDWKMMRKIFFDQIQTPVTLFSGKLWSTLVVRLAYSADLRSRLGHVSSAPSVAYSTGCSRVVTNLGTNPTPRCLTPVIWREPVYHRR